MRNSNCRCVFGPHRTKRSQSLFSNLTTNKQAICNSTWEQNKTMVHNWGRIDFIIVNVSSAYQSKRKRATSGSPLNPFSSFSTLHLGKFWLTLVFPCWWLLCFFDCLPSSERQICFSFFGFVLRSFMACSHRSFLYLFGHSNCLFTTLAETGKKTTCDFSWESLHRHPGRNTADARAFISGP